MSASCCYDDEFMFVLYHDVLLQLHAHSLRGTALMLSECMRIYAISVDVQPHSVPLCMAGAIPFLALSPPIASALPLLPAGIAANPALWQVRLCPVPCRVPDCCVPLRLVLPPLLLLKTWQSRALSGGQDPSEV